MAETKKSTSEVLHVIQQAKRKYQMFAEAESALQVLQGLEQNQAELTVIVAGLKQEQIAAQEAVDAAHLTATKLLQETNETVAAKIEQAKYDAKVIIKEAEDRIAEKAKASQEKVAVADARAEAQIKVANDLADDITEARKTLEDLNKKIADARKAASAILAG